MKSAKTLHSILSIIIYLILLVIAVGIIMLVLFLTGILDTSTIFNDITEYLKDPSLYVFMGLILIVYGIFVYGLCQLRAAAKGFISHQFYDINHLKNLSIAGKCFVLTGTFAWLFDGLSSIYFQSKFSLSMNDKTFMYLFIIAIGLFIMIIGQALNDARQLKEENELTI